MADDGIRLPSALAGVTVQRAIVIDGALLYLVTAALSGLVELDLRQVGRLTAEDAQAALYEMIYTYVEGP